MRLALGSDHAGYVLKEKIKAFLRNTGVEVNDCGTDSPESVDYPDFARKVGAEINSGKSERGILFCGTGIGMSIAANKIPGIRAAMAQSPDAARLSRLHNDANVLCLAGRFMDPALAQEIVKVWLATPFEGGRHQRRVDKITALERGSQ
jgi:RpiB/LacA/LacB family sugar-phosphate isomerase